MGSRSKARKRAVDVLYEADLRGLEAVTLLSERLAAPEAAPVADYTVTLVEGIAANLRRIDEVLVEHAEGWTLGRMPAVDRAVLRLGLYELLWSEDVPPAVAIDESVELVKDLSTDDSPRFVNGVLGRIAGISDRLRTSIRNLEAAEAAAAERAESDAQH
ncbi:MAG: transcription antitermination factor NusB [Saccharopolyspora sp.]|uniref:transcription antitermination factor NusB n=1 Tax=Saccharopolyspora TaxID=1835 RepID=UPI001909B152|nr:MULTISPECIES: transcription antitermination factor NusB [unclassified Saccharopolyspora]MBK0867130.1 transcription antitermination factor NusB [Saccharopolyspora sp. HNM0986]MBQ6644954.1 transcription antitermination factor NusB [Saccharopolyspora sp.]